MSESDYITRELGKLKTAPHRAFKLTCIYIQLYSTYIFELKYGGGNELAFRLNINMATERTRI